MSKVMKISIIGSGVVGTIIGTGFEKLGQGVVFYDVNSERVERLKANIGWGLEDDEVGNELMDWDKEVYGGLI